VPVTGISGVPDTVTAGEDIDLTLAAAEPATATNRVIVWEVKEPGDTGAVITDGILRTDNEGTLSVTAVIAGGLADSSDYTDEFSIEVRPGLDLVISRANAAKTGVVLSVDGSDVPEDTDWVSQTVLDAFNEAIASAETIAQTPSAAQSDKDAALSALTEATEVFNAAKKPGAESTDTPSADKTALNAAVAAANAAKTGIAVSAVNGSDVPADSYWANQAAFDALNGAIASAETIVQTPAAAQSDINAAASTLTAATGVFNAAKRKGTQLITLKTVSLTGGLSFNLRYVSPPGPGGFKYDGGAVSIATVSKGYWVAETEVTQELFQAVMGANPAYFASSAAASGETGSKRPVESITWYAAFAFCNKLSLLDGRSPVYSVKVNGIEVDWAKLPYEGVPVQSKGNINKDWNAVTKVKGKNGYRLPYEMEWIWAAMGGSAGGATVTSNGWTKAFAGSNGANSIGDYAWYTGNSGKKTHEVAKKLPNELGLYDMSGNVAEWCWEEDGLSVINVTSSVGGLAPAASVIEILRHSTPDAPAYLFRGGGYPSTAAICAVSYRGEEGHSHAYDNLSYVGIRVVLDQ
jgi:formylglycine-generating enzyme required for sulfatase activity